MAKIGLTKKRIIHSLSVARKMKEMALEMHPDDEQFSEEMYTLGLLHDIGYEFIERQEDRSVIGGTILKAQDYKYWKEVYYHGFPDCKYHSEALNILNEADMTTGTDGEYITAIERVRELQNRYGSNSIQYKNAKALATELNLINNNNY